jgi:acetylornithine/succinyldiaminopimelate/putrescine aminotransferase
VTHPDAAIDSRLVKDIQKDTHYLLPLYARPPLVIAKGEGCVLTDTQGRAFLDMNSGIAVNALGHNHPRVVKVIAEQAKEMIHLSNLYHHPYGGPFAKALVDALGCDQPACPGVGHCQSGCSSKGRLGPDSKVFFCNSGAEANEGAIKFARKVGKNLDSSGAKNEIVSFMNAFHGRTLGALSATPSPKYQKPFLPLVPGFIKAPFNDTQAAMEAISSKTCAVIVEPIQGEGGIHVSHRKFLMALREKCDQVGALLIFDEIQVGHF